MSLAGDKAVSRLVCGHGNSPASGEEDNDTSPVATFGSDLSIEVTSWIDYDLTVDMTFLNDKSGRYQHRIVSALSTDLVGDIDLDQTYA